MQRIRIALLSAFCVLAVTACTDFSKYTKEGNDLVSQYAPQANDLLKSSDALKERAAKLPTSLEGVTDAVGAVAKNNDTIKDLKGQLDGFSGKLDGAVKAGNVDDVTKLLNDQKTASTTGLTNAGTELKSLTEKVSMLETKAADAAKLAALPKAPVSPPVQKEEVKPSTFTKALASGFSVSGNPMGIEAQLIAFIEDAGKAVDKTTWFNFDRLTFNTGSADLDMDKSKDQLTNIAEILKAYPKVTIKVGGYTDNQGSAATNKKLSTDRANNVAKALTGMGVVKTRLSPEGYGPEHPVCAANDTEECRAQNRRIAVRVSAK